MPCIKGLMPAGGDCAQVELQTQISNKASPWRRIECMNDSRPSYIDGFLVETEANASMGPKSKAVQCGHFFLNSASNL
jgi:hypothetical protein